MPTRIEIELVPASSWGDNLRSRLSRADWDKLRHAQYAAAEHRCEICGDTGRLECHEVWSYNETDCVQKLERLIALCPGCHEVKHYGLACIRGRGDAAFSRLCRLNGWGAASGKRHVDTAFKEWERRSRMRWVLDLTILDEKGVSLLP